MLPPSTVEPAVCTALLQYAERVRQDVCQECDVWPGELLNTRCKNRRVGRARMLAMVRLRLHLLQRRQGRKREFAYYGLAGELTLEPPPGWRFLSWPMISRLLGGHHTLWLARWQQYIEERISAWKG